MREIHASHANQASLPIAWIWRETEFMLPQAGISDAVVLFRVCAVSTKIPRSMADGSRFVIFPQPQRWTNAPDYGAWPVVGFVQRKGTNWLWETAEK